MMTKTEALRTLIETVAIAQKRGALALHEAAAVWQAILEFQPDNSTNDSAMEDNSNFTTPDEDSLGD